MVDKVIHLLTLDEQVLEERCFPAYNGRYAALHIFSRGEKSNGRPAPVLEPRPASGQELIVLVRLAEGVADDDTIDDIGHRVAPYPMSFTTVDSFPYTATTFTAMRL
jgi:hypothetical protein